MKVYLFLLTNNKFQYIYPQLHVITLKVKSKAFWGGERVNERLQLLIKYLTALAGVQASGIKVRDEILQTIKTIEGEIEGYEDGETGN